MAIMEPGKRVRRALAQPSLFAQPGVRPAPPQELVLGVRGPRRRVEARATLAGSCYQTQYPGISTVLETRWQRDEGSQTGPKSGLPGRLAPQKLAPGLSISYDRYG